ncbi:hypothetical protein [Pseudonocardia spinosispora]|uniref:hypothetical protein n=1 Tax=Pseudonocardia spinosispora TaxID=103441 RepID=UPI000412422F|nr:hypothetical protein [Pseudonocardia spinosispora]
MTQDGSIVVDLLVNVAANIIAAFVVGFIALAILTGYRSRGVRRFFGVASGGSSIKIFLSTIAVNPGGTRGTAEIKEGFHGDAMTELEYKHALEFAALMRSGSFSWILTTIFGTRSGADRILSTIEHSPSFRQNTRVTPGGEVSYDSNAISASLRENTCTILIGGPIYNLLTHHIFRHRPKNADDMRFFEFIRRNDPDGKALRGIRALGVYPRDYIRTEGEDHIEDYFVVCRLTVEKKKKVFVCAGTCTAATAAAVDQLTDWRKFEKYGTNDFGVLYRIFLPRASTGFESSAQGRESDPDDATAMEWVCDFKRKPPKQL